MPDLAWLGVLRGRFLLLALSSVALGVAIALPPGPLPAGWLGEALLVLCGALAAHAAVNALNEYHDFRSGLDLQTRRTPFSGGSGTLPAHPQYLQRALWLGIACLLLCIAIGGHFLLSRPQLLPGLAPLGLLGLLLVVFYSPWLTRHPWACLVAPGLGFGPLMVLGTQQVLGAAVDADSLGLALVPFFLANNLLLLNQWPDVQADRAVGRRTLPMQLGLAGVSRVLAVQWLLAYALLLAQLLWGNLAAAALGLLGAPLAWRTLQLLRGGRLLAALQLNVMLTLLTPLLMAAGLFGQWLAA